MSKKKKILISVSVVLTILAIFVVCVVVSGQYFPKDTDIKDYKNTSWLGYIKDDALVSNIALPGSHDAGSYNMSYLGRTQGYSIQTQLDMGTRYFDLRVNKTDKGYFMFHGPFNGENFVDVLSALTNFITANRSETLILDFQHFNGDSEQDVLNMVKEALVVTNLVVRNTSDKSDLEFISTLTLGEARGKCVILFGGNEDIVDEYDYIFGRNNDECTKTGKALNSCYISEYNKMNSKKYITTALPFYYQNIKDKIENEGHKGLFILQGQLTDGALIFGPYSKERSHDDNMTAYINAIANDAEKLALTNIIMRDFLTSDKCEDIIALNLHKGIVKDTLTDEFNSIFNV